MVSSLVHLAVLSMASSLVLLAVFGISLPCRLTMPSLAWLYLAGSPCRPWHGSTLQRVASPNITNIPIIMWNPFKKSPRKETLNNIRNIAASFAILNEFQRRGLLHFHREKGKVSNGSPVGSLLIEQSLATVQLAQGADKFRDFLNKVAQWQNYQLLQEAYESHRIDHETRAVREAQRKYVNLTKADIDRIRQNARDNMPPTVSGNALPDLIQEFDMFIIKATAPSASEAVKSVSGDASPESNGHLVALGHWDGTRLEMALYDDIKHNLFQ